MAAALLEAGFRLRVHNRTRARADALVARGAEWAETPAAAAVPGGVTVTMLPDDQALEDVTLGRGGLLEGMAPGAVPLGQGTFDFGEEPSAVALVKLAGNLLIASVLESLGEAAALVERGGIPRAEFIEMMTGTLFACPVYQGYGRAIARGHYHPAGFRLSLGAKDAELIAEAARARGVSAPLADLLLRRFRSALDKGRGELDWAAAALEPLEGIGSGLGSGVSRSSSGPVRVTRSRP